MKTLRILLLLATLPLVSVSASEPVHIIFDTDISGDVDDALALAMLHALADRHECVIDAVTISKINPLTAPFVDAVNTFYGRGEIPIGVTHDSQHRESKYLHLVEKRDEGELRYPHDLMSSDDAPDAVELLRRVLADADDDSVVIVQVGLATNLADLIETPGDDISPLTGLELVSQKVQMVSVMAGAFAPIRGNARYFEANVKHGVDAMQRFAQHWPDDVPVVWSDFRIGLAALYPRESIARDFQYHPHHLISEAYLTYCGPDHDRPSWDLTSVLYAVRPDEGYFGLSQPGRVTVADDGFTSFAAAPGGRDRYLVLPKKSVSRVVTIQRALVSQPPLKP
ncbi:Inosine-uridine preferring nucleoside hydrolase [Allorhodopirellula solitaria]|uniref:Inosine-uridine preferring nucleoside hydrolase n=2 Tax=Allorhodopirellula solitaria TaxID=2527987 RepID=A0A5C5X0B0_9BACT|nr:nucleoside hydrolase [Allorhodopirellula solitaria]TWT56386.1 Inosine-uridine preferring nucleoside hydrolase [Allorhodopirellula solitaria]